MKTHFILISLFVFSTLFAQTQLSDSKRHSSDFYIYKTNQENLRKIYIKGKNPEENMLQSFDSH